jgi:hypothetical protein
MRKFTVFENFEVDLDDEKTYDFLPKTKKELRDLMFKEIGYAHCYMNFWYKDIFDEHDGCQKKRVENLIKNFTENEKENYHNDNLMWYKEQIFLFQCEIENMC